MDTMKRFSVFGASGYWAESEVGDFVRFADHAAAVHRLNNELTAITLERDGLKRRLLQIRAETCVIFDTDSVQPK